MSRKVNASYTADQVKGAFKVRTSDIGGLTNPFFAFEIRAFAEISDSTRTTSNLLTFLTFGLPGFSILVEVVT